MKLLLFAVYAAHVGAMNIAIGEFVPTIPILSDLTPMVTEVQQKNFLSGKTTSDWRVMTHREYNKINPNFCQKLGNTGMCLNPVFQGY